MFKLDLLKAEEPEIKLPTSVGSYKKQENSRKTSTSALLITPKPLTVWITSNSKILQEVRIPDHLTSLLKNLYADQEQQLELDMEQGAGSNLGKENHMAICCHPAYLTYMQSTSCRRPGWMKHKLESRLPGETYNLRYADDITLVAESEEELKSLLMKVKEESEKAGLKLIVENTNIMASGPISS